eukprot:TRINITY_DN39387_c0_g1_i1.p1 TRINITY_DN39387_c0_g1~~TRINITY_DN39387_c0_g1_i1.p1  ORF type:complete len:515 (+),score=85.70 TRINITY_DN39387_c0_g1_i1:89-1633(+)
MHFPTADEQQIRFNQAMARAGDEEEEEGDYAWRRPARALKPASSEDEEDDDPDGDAIDVPDESDVVEAVGSALRAGWEQVGSGLRRRKASAQAVWAPAGGLGLDDDDFLLGSERMDDSGWRQAASGRSPPWGTLLGCAATVAATAVLGVATRPGQEAFVAMHSRRYSSGGSSSSFSSPSPAAREPQGDEDLPGSYLPLVLTDRSFDGRVAWTRYVDHKMFSVATVALTVSASPAKGGGERNKTEADARKVYLHRYLGVYGMWFPLPYLPQPGRKLGTYGVGACVASKCVCLPDLRTRVKKGAKNSGGGCWRFRAGKAAALNAMAAPNLALFGLWQLPAYWSTLGAHATFSVANLRRGHVWTLFSAPFSHRSWGEGFRNAIILANTVDTFEKADVSYWMFLILYLGGCWAYWLSRTLYRSIRCDHAFYTQEHGASGGLAAQLLFLARSNPEFRYTFSLYFIPMPVELSAWRSLLAHAAIDVFFGHASKNMWMELASLLGAWTFGWLMFGAWSMHD